MSKFCPMCNQITNCTENRTQCIEEEETDMQTLTLNAWGPSIKSHST